MITKKTHWQEICEQFLATTGYDYGDFERDELLNPDPGQKPPAYYSHGDAVVVILLGEPVFPQEKGSYWELLKNRRTKRNYTGKSLTLNELNLLLWGTQGITADLGDYQARTASSAGALYPIETYLLINNVEGLEKGLYHLNVKDWTLEGVKLGDFGDFAVEVTDGQEQTRHAAVNFVWTAMVERTRYKYKERAYRYIFWDSGHIAQNLHLASAELGLGVTTIGHWYDVPMNSFLGIDGKEHLSILMASVGKVAGQDWLADRRPPVQA
ncbi:dehydrogenase [Tumebacillus avium]|uniref:Dehydrogenase n=1 Tax=Tumebacillus avium TaxID=1903704 RepID=A0A1Y0INV3_9BACL|nr:SagB/ThcOx family dehydrogenase [Tumebacillus avium]ARU61185.1 dehydrogenase [Tumebacillus avium]